MIMVKNLLVDYLYSCWKKCQILINSDFELVNEEWFSLSIKVVVLAIVIVRVDLVYDIFCDLQGR